jgi:hypothetical protein
MRRRRWVTVLLVALVAGCADTGAPTTPTGPPTSGGSGSEGGVQVQRRAFAIDKADRSTLYRFPRLDPHAAVTLEKVGVWPARRPTCRAPTCPATAGA